MYERIKRTPPVRQRYAEQLAREGVMDVAQADADAERFSQRLAEVQQSLKAHLSEETKGEEPQRISGAQHAIAEPELRQDVGDVCLDRCFAQEEHYGDLAVRESSRDELEDLEFTLGQLRDLGRRAGSRRPPAHELLD